jgi:hypothetical protein
MNWSKKAGQWMGEILLELVILLYWLNVQAAPFSINILNN